jgi:hypothetical protein
MLRSALPRRRPRPSYEPGHDARARRIIAAHIARHGLWCPGAPELGHLAHQTSGEGGGKLTLDHRVPRVLGGTAADGTRVLCQRWNTIAGRDAQRAARELRASGYRAR